MKIRKGFISNSSSTSFICEVCAETVTGWDMGLDEADMYECENGHTFCRDESIGNVIVSEDDKEIITEITLIIEDEENANEIPAKNCPCCTFGTVSQYDLIDYLLKKTGMNKETVAKELREKFPVYAAFKEYCENDVEEK